MLFHGFCRLSDLCIPDRRITCMSWPYRSIIRRLSMWFIAAIYLFADDLADLQRIWHTDLASVLQNSNSRYRKVVSAIDEGLRDVSHAIM
ncbi:hypothetical protein L1987_51612 [Smallanthus sonchifolius]|uniref:Uncharacterized protein n=1 Tax=Smallanthus sonchifolius TaxID=185202 RepID=A0ACB9ER46_9ASTR|nr:hypothetical protein L1987_51612 [Smallanthus sonchifolius]